jgi:glycosyltransferase involved in cell wall biosynthesis
LKLIIVHYHLRPGGIRRIIELATPHLVRHFDRAVESVVLACGEARDKKWNQTFRNLLQPVPVEFFVETSFNYLSEQRSSAERLARQIHDAIERLLTGAEARSCLVWTHNPGIGRNLLLMRELVRATAARHVPLIAHHHDWWFDNRWLRRPEMFRFGFRTLSAPARTIFPAGAHVRHVAINSSDARLLQRHFSGRAAWLPNLAGAGSLSASGRARATRRWLHHELADRDAPVWLLPCRLLRRKNVAEALLLTRWLRPEAWLVTAGDVSSADERPYAVTLTAAVRRHRWRLRLGILAGDETGKPSVDELLEISEAVLLTSIQEGFGLPYLEAAAARRPLIARRIPNIAPDLERFGFRFPYYYDDVWIDPRLFEWRAEQKRQARLFASWRGQLPHACRRWVGTPIVLAGESPRPVPFSRLTLTAQLEVLAWPVGESWRLCVPLNPALARWRERAAARRLQPTRWPRKATNWLSGRAYARRFRQIIHTNDTTPLRPEIATTAQEDFIRERLGADHLFPLLWSCDS